MTVAGLFLILTLAVPLGTVLACLSAAFRTRVIRLLAIAPLPAVIAAVVAPGDTLVLFPSPFRITLALDLPGAILLGGSAVLWSMAGAYATSYMGQTSSSARFAMWWLLTLAGSLGVFIVADLASFYLVFTLVSLAAYGLIAHEETIPALHAGTVYVVLALVGEACLLLALVMLANSSPDANPLIRDVVAILPTSRFQNAIIALLVAGFALKMGLVPLHVWLPLAHPAAPMPASAVLSGVVVNAGVIGLIRFMPFETGLPFWGSVLTALGLLTAYYGVAVGITQMRPKTILAYSTVSQMGLIAAILGVGLQNADASAQSLASYYALHHTLAKGALFLAVGVIAATGDTHRRIVLLITAILALSLGGLPLTSGILAKLATKPVLGYGFVGQASTLAAAGSTLLMLHFLTRIAQETARQAEAVAPTQQLVPWLVLAAFSLAIPSFLYPRMTGETIWSALHISVVVGIIWPMALGALMWLALVRFKGRRPAVPEGDIIVLAYVCAPGINRLARGIERLDTLLCRWPIAGLALLTIAIVLGAGALQG